MLQDSLQTAMRNRLSIASGVLRSGAHPVEGDESSTKLIQSAGKKKKGMPSLSAKIQQKKRGGAARGAGRDAGEKSSSSRKVSKHKSPSSRPAGPFTTEQSFPDLADFGRINSDDATEQSSSCGCSCISNVGVSKVQTLIAYDDGEEMSRREAHGGLTIRNVPSFDEDNDATPELLLWEDIIERSTFEDSDSDDYSDDGDGDTNVRSGSKILHRNDLSTAYVAIRASERVVEVELDGIPVEMMRRHRVY